MTVCSGNEFGRLPSALGRERISGPSYQIRLSQATEDPDWDAFVAQTPGGDHVQTSLWAQVKAAANWRAARVVVAHGQTVVAGAQLLFRPLPLAGAIGYVPKGPLVAVDDPALRALIMDQLVHAARALHVRYLAVQPPY